MSTDLYEPDHRLKSPFEGDRRLTNVIRVRYRINHIQRRADARQLRLEPGDQVIVEDRHGPVIAEVTSNLKREVVDRSELPPILRRATDGDLRRAESNEQLEEEAFRFCLERIRARELPMKLVRTRSMQDRSRIVFYFCADGRIDFRKLVRDLARKYRTRIEMYQIGVRDGAQLIGGIGPCGRELCCSTFLDHFEPVSIRIAKEQGLTLSPDKISGMCGRLMCCLVYEQKVYRRLRSRLPEVGQAVQTPHGDATVQSLDLINRRVQVTTTGEGKRLTLSIEEVSLTDPSAKASENDDPSERPLWDGDPPRKRTSPTSSEDP